MVAFIIPYALEPPGYFETIVNKVFISVMPTSNRTYDISDLIGIGGSIRVLRGPVPTDLVTEADVDHQLSTPEEGNFGLPQYVRDTIDNRNPVNWVERGDDFESEDE